MTRLTILRVLPEELGFNGSSGNVTVLERRAAWRGVDVRIVDLPRGATPPGDVDLVVVGSGQEATARRALPELLGHAQALRALAAAGVPFLGIAAGWHLLGRRIEWSDGVAEEAVGVLPTAAVFGADWRAVGEVHGAAYDGREVAGFENHATRVERGGRGALATLGREPGGAPEGTDAADGVLAGASIGTNLNGPFLALNPSFADDLLQAALVRRGEALPAADERVRRADEHAARARAAIAGRLGATR